MLDLLVLQIRNAAPCDSSQLLLRPSTHFVQEEAQSPHHPSRQR